MDYKQLAVQIGLNVELISNIEMASKSGCDFESLIELFYSSSSNQNQDQLLLQEVKKEAEKNQIDFRIVFAYTYVQLAVKAYDEYKKRNISDQIYFDTMGDLAIWSKDCYKKIGVWGIDEYNWLKQHVQLKLFRLGRLQFQPLVLDEAIRCEEYLVEKGECVLNVHIPEGEPLKYDKCVESYKMAKAFFKNDRINFICASWLLYPIYREILPNDSNIVRFQEDYCLYGIDDFSRQAEERIFGEISDNLDSYIQNTSLQKLAVKCLKEGKKLGLGKGIKAASTI